VAVSAPERIDSIVDAEMDVLAIAHLDFHTCQTIHREELELVPGLSIPTGFTSCENAADWVAICLRCRHRFFTCDPCRALAATVTKAICTSCGVEGADDQLFAYVTLSGGA
jgi:hypothetical protein